jgi:hypothetical protein
MRPIACAGAALLLAFAVACNDEPRDETASRTDRTAQAAEDAARDAAADVERSAEDAANAFRDYSYERRDEFRLAVRERLDTMDVELEELERDAREGADQTRIEAVEAARQARIVVDRNLDRLTEATQSTWEDLKRQVNESLDTAELRLRALKPDAKPMGGTGGPS